MPLLLIISLLATTTLCLTSAQVCYSTVSSYTRSSYNTPEIYYYSQAYTYYTSCGFLGWSRCSRTGYSRRSGYRQGTRYSSTLQYARVSMCCSGYAGTPPNCEPVCSVCYNGGTCTAPEICNCNTGWTGNTCNMDVDECAADTDGCDHICMNTPGGYSCSCNTGYNLDPNGLTCTDIDECGISALGGMCSQVCVNTPGSYECQCNIGYRLSSDGFTCEDIDECLDNNGGCNQGCTNVDGSYECSCDVGYFLSDDQRTCVDHDECETGSHTCTQICNNLPGTHECMCYTGYELLDDGYTCEDINECELGYCNHYCNNSVGSFTCSCQDGYALEDDDRTCVDIDECAIANGGCDHFCSNYPGFYRCSCRGGYTLEEDGSCIAQPCPNLMRPQNGDISCTGPQVTDENCTFSCDAGYQLYGTVLQQCLPDNTWSGELVECQIMSCPELTEPLNGAIILPCEHEFRSTCNLRCDDGFYSNDVLTQSCVLSADNSYVEWTEAPVCNAIRACEPYPCQYSGVCTALGPREFECDCTGTGYEGDMCQYGIIDLPQYPTLIAEDPPQQLSISARPGYFITIEFVADDPLNLIFDPPSVTIHYPNTSVNFSVSSTLPNLYEVNYVITGGSSDEFPKPQPSTVLVTPLSSATPNSYFTDRSVAIGLLQPGCCQLQDTTPSYQCPNGGQTLAFDATCNWRQQGSMHSVPGLIFTNLNELTVPASISGTELEFSNNLVSLNQLNTADLNEPCNECRTIVRGNDSITNVGDDCTVTFKPTISDLNDFLNTESLAYSYFHYTNSLYPSWLELLPINGNSRTHDTNSYQVTLVDSNELNDINGCEDLPVVEPGLYSVLQYSGALNVSIPSIDSHDIYTPTDDATPLCFAVNLCAGSTTPFYIGLPTEAQPFFASLPFIQYPMDHGWYIDSKALAVAVGNGYLNIDVVDRLIGFQYWGGIEDLTVSDYFGDTSLAVQGMVDRNFTKEDLLCTLDFEGLSFIQYHDLNEAYNTGLQRRWIGAMDGSIHLTIQVFVQGENSVLVLDAEETPGLFFIGEWEDECVAVEPTGLSFILTYMPSTDNTGLWSSIFRVPPILIFGLPTQSSCPVDAFVALDSNMNMRGVQLRSQCVDVNVGRFQFNGNSLIHTLSVVGNADDYNLICVTDDIITSDTRVFLQTKFTSNTDSLQLGYFMTLRPNENLNALTTAFFKDTSSFIGKMYVVDFMLLGTRFTTEVDIDQDGLQFTTNCNMFNRYPVQLTGMADQNSEWNGLPLRLSGNFVMSPTNIPYLLQAEIHDYVKFIGERAQLSQQSASMALQRARNQFESISNTYTTRLQDYEATCREYDEAMAELQNATAEQSATQDAVDLAEGALQEARQQIDNICMIEVCNDICIPGTVCEECTAVISSTVQGTCQVPCEKTDYVQMYVGVRAYSCWRWLTVLQCVYLCYCPSWSICVAGRACWYTSVCASTTCYEDIYETVPITYTGTCIGQCDTGVMSTDVVEQCCVLSDCGNLVPNSTCTQLNDQCQMARDAAYAQLSTSEASLYEPLERLDVARQRVSRAQVNVTRLRSEKGIAEQLLNQSVMAYTASQSSVEFTQMVYEQLTEQLNQSLILANIINEATGHVVEVNDVKFMVTVITESPSSIPVIVNYSFPLLGTSHLEEIILDFNYINSSLMQRAIDLTNAAFNLLSRRRKRQADDNTITEQRGIDRNAMYYGERCTDIRNLQDYVNELVKSLEIISNVSTTSKDAVMSNVMALNNLSAESMNINVTSAVNLTHLEMEFGATVNMTELMSGETSAVTSLLNDLEELTLQLANSIGENSFSEWQLKMEDLHNQTESAAGHFCFGFSDCLVTVGEVTGNLLRLTPLPEATELLVKLQEAENDLLDLALQTNLAIDEAISKTDKILNILEEFSQLNYWCASVPNITVQPEERVTTVENNTVTLTCEAESLAPVNYKWKKGGTDVPDANSNTLVIGNIKFSDVDNYTCIATNHIGSVMSSNASVEVQELPAFFLQPDHQDIYLKDQNGAQFKCNATGVPYPGFRWYYRPHNATEYTVVPGEDQNEYTIPNTIPEHEGVYYCEAYNEQGAVQSRQVNLTVLGTTVAQLAQYVTFNIDAVTNDSFDDVIDEASNLTVGSDSPEDTLIKHLITVVSDMLDLRRTTIENVTIITLDDTSLSITMGLYSYNISYSGINGDNLLVIGPEARSEWGVVINELLNAWQNEEVIISDGITAYQVSSSSLQIGDIQLACPIGSVVYEDNQFLCVNCPAGSYQVNKRMIQVNEDGSETTVIMPECVECPIGAYQYVQGQTQCTICPEYHTTRRTSTRLSEDCIVLCPPGEYSIDGLAPCSKCPTGEYQNSQGQLQCVVCPDYHNTYNEGSVQYDDCLPLCSPGNYSTNGFEPCDECPCGSYSEVYGAVECNNCSTIGAPQDQCNEICSTAGEDQSEKNEVSVAAIAGGAAGGVAVIIVVMLVIFAIIVMSRKRSKDRQERLIIQDDSGDPWDDKRHYKYDFTKAADDYANKHLKENDIDEEFAQGAVVNPMYEPDGTVIKNPTYLSPN